MKFRAQTERLGYRRSWIFGAPIATAFATLIVPAAAHADGDFPPSYSNYIRVGYAHVSFSMDATPIVGGVVLADANAKASRNQTIGVEFGHFLTHAVSVSLIVGAPPTTSITGTGIMAGVPFGRITYGPAILAANYHVNGLGRFRPFVGAGANYTVILSTHDDAMIHLRAKNAVGFVARGGADVALTRRIGLFASVQKILVSTDINAEVNPAIPGLGGAPVSARAKLDPLIVHTGLTFSF